MIMNKVPNIITILRIVLSILFLFIKPYSIYFYIIYILCGLSDILDGYIARKINSATQRGALLDTIADITMVFILFIVLIPIIKIPYKALIWIVIISLIRIISIIVAFYKYNTLVMLHTYSNKLIGIALFLTIIFYKNIHSNSILIYIVCIIATISSAEELAIHITSKKLNRDIKSIFSSL